MAKSDWETDGTRDGYPVFCPVNAGSDCPYCDKENKCHIADPVKDCDDFSYFFENWIDWLESEDVDPDAPEDFSEEEIETIEELLPMEVKPEFVKIARLFSDSLIEDSIPFTIERILDGYKWTFPDIPGGDVIIHSGSYSHAFGMVESWGMPWDEDDVSVLAPTEMEKNIYNEIHRND